jgi:hypothetical protein
MFFENCLNNLLQTGCKPDLHLNPLDDPKFEQCLNPDISSDH